jgi:hypothetical protein
MNVAAEASEDFLEEFLGEIKRQQEESRQKLPSSLL